MPRDRRIRSWRPASSRTSGKRSSGRSTRTSPSVSGWPSRSSSSGSLGSRSRESAGSSRCSRLRGSPSRCFGRAHSSASAALVFIAGEFERGSSSTRRPSPSTRRSATTAVARRCSTGCRTRPWSKGTFRARAPSLRRVWRCIAASETERARRSCSGRSRISTGAPASTASGARARTAKRRDRGRGRVRLVAVHACSRTCASGRSSSESGRTPSGSASRRSRSLTGSTTECNRIYLLALLARAAAEDGRLERAGELWGALEADEARGPIGQWEDEREAYAAPVLAHADDAFERGRSRGHARSLDEVVADACRNA